MCGMCHVPLKLYSFLSNLNLWLWENAQFLICSNKLDTISMRENNHVLLENAGVKLFVFNNYHNSIYEFS